MNTRLNSRNIFITLLVSYVGGFAVSLMVTQFSTKRSWLALSFIFGLIIVIAAAIAISEPEMEKESWWAAIFVDPDFERVLPLEHSFGIVKGANTFINNWYYYTSHSFADSSGKERMLVQGGLQANFRPLSDSIVHLAEIGIYGVLTGMFFGDDPPMFTETLRQSFKNEVGEEVEKPMLKFDTYTMSGKRWEGFSDRYSLRPLPKVQVQANPYLELIKNSDLVDEFMYGEMICFPVPKGTKIKYRHYWRETPNRMASRLTFDNHYICLEIDLFCSPGMALMEDEDFVKSVILENIKSAEKLSVNITVLHRGKLFGSLLSKHKSDANLQWAKYVRDLIKNTTLYDYHLESWKAENSILKAETSNEEHVGGERGAEAESGIRFVCKRIWGFLRTIFGLD